LKKINKQIKNINRERQQIYKGKIRIWDEGIPRKEIKIELGIRILDANDNPPQFENTNYELILPMKVEMGDENYNLNIIKIFSNH
jgi:hypothetical protein